MDEQEGNDLSGWFSTYGLITSRRILESYKIPMNEQELRYTLRSADTFYHRLLRIPLKNVFNGIILQQVNDYQVYAQKLFIDYLLSGQSGKDEDAQGAHTRELLEEERNSMIFLSKKFHSKEIVNERLIAKSQASLIQHAADWQNRIQNLSSQLRKKLVPQFTAEAVLKGLVTLLIHCRIKQGRMIMDETEWTAVETAMGAALPPESRQLLLADISNLGEYAVESEQTLDDFYEQISDMNLDIRQFRSDFYDTILRVNNLITLLPDYTINVEQVRENRETLFFDTGLGNEA